MSLRRSMEQLRPARTQKVDLQEKVQQILLTEGLTAAQWEQVICVAYNMSTGLTQAQAISKGQVTLEQSKIKANLKVGKKIVENAFKSTSGVMQHYGSGTNDLTSGWEDYFVKYTGKPAATPTKTPKTDMKLGKKNISLKKYGGSQLMSGGRAETLATLGFAYDNAPDSIKTKAFDKAWNKINKNIEEEYIKFKLPPGGQIGKIATDKMKVDKKIKDLVKDSLTKQSAMTNALREIFADKNIKTEVVREAMTGNAKFANKNASANAMMKFGKDGSGELISIDNSLVAKYTNQTKFNISFKTSGTGGNAWTALKGIYKEENDILDNIISESITETDKEILNEGLFSKAVDKVKSWISKFINKVWEKLKAFLLKGLDIALNLLGAKMDIAGNGPQIKI